MHNEHEPILHNAAETGAAFARFYEVLARLRAPDGCPWDRAQTPLTMRSDLIEETFEAVDAITEADTAHIQEELGDVLLNTAMIAYMHEQQNAFTMTEVLDTVSEKLVRRHPHVFSESAGKSEVTEDVKTPEQVLNQWDKIKQNVEHRAAKSILDEVASGLPPLLRSAKLQKKAAKLNFDWQTVEPVYGKITEELNEVKAAAKEAEEAKKADVANKTAITAATATNDTAANTEPQDAPSAAVKKAYNHLEEEIGDLLFAVVNAARKLGVDPAVALNRANAKFYRRFTYVERIMKESGTPMDSAHFEHMDALWEQAKRLESDPDSALV